MSLIYMSLVRFALRLALYDPISRFRRLQIDSDRFHGNFAGTKTWPGKLKAIQSHVAPQLIVGHQSPSADSIYQLPARHGATELIELQRTDIGLPSKAFASRRRRSDCSHTDQPCGCWLSDQSCNQVAVAETALGAIKNHMPSDASEKVGETA